MGSAELLMSPMSNLTIDFANFALSVEESFRVPQDSKWSFRTAVRSYLRRAKIKKNKYATDDKKQQLASKLNAKWTRRPICSTVPARVWQKYLLKMSYKHLANWPYKSANEPDPDIAWVNDVLCIMPVKDDRVLPAELVKILIDTGRWRRADFQVGPPNHRLGDDVTRESEHFNRSMIQPTIRRGLRPDLRNQK